MKVLVGLFLFLLVVTTAAAVALFTGVISIAQSQPPVPQPNPAAAAQAPAAAGQPQRPQPRVTKRETHGDWLYVCVENPQDKAVRCSISQELSEPKSKQSIFLWRISQDGNGGLVSIWQTPQAVLLPRGITVDAGTPQPIVVPYQTCASGRCEAIANLAADFQDSLAKAQKASATIFLRNGKAVNLPLSVKGLAEALAVLQQGQPAAAAPPG